MFNKQELKFRKNWENEDFTGYSTIKDNVLIETILELADYYDLKVKKIVLNDVITCKVIIKGDRRTYLIFVGKLLKRVGNYLTDIRCF